MANNVTFKVSFEQLNEAGTAHDARIRCWGVKENDRISLNKVYVANLEYNEKWGFSTRSIKRSFRRLT